MDLSIKKVLKDSAAWWISGTKSTNGDNVDGKGGKVATTKAAAVLITAPAWMILGSVPGCGQEKTQNGPDTEPPTFSGLSSATAKSETSIELTWKSASDNSTDQADVQYLIYMSETSEGQDFSSPTFVTATGANFYWVTGLKPNTKYYFIIRARDLSGNEDENRVQISASTNPDLKPPRFDGIRTAEMLSDTSIKLNWDPASDNFTDQNDIQYLIYVSETRGGQNFSAPSFVTDAGATFYTVGNLKPDTGYHFVVKARDTAGNIDPYTFELYARTDLPAPYNDPYGSNPLLIDDFNDGDLNPIIPPNGCGRWTAQDESSCTVLSNPGGYLRAEIFRKYWYSFSLTTYGYCEYNVSDYNYVEFDIKGNVNYCDFSISQEFYPSASRRKISSENFIHVKYPIAGQVLTSGCCFYKLAFWPANERGNCDDPNSFNGQSESDWVEIDNVTFTK